MDLFQFLVLVCRSHGVLRAQPDTKTEMVPCASLFPVPLWVFRPASLLLEILAYFQLADYHGMTKEDDHHMDYQYSDEVEVEGEAPLLLFPSHVLPSPRRFLNAARNPDIGLDWRLLPVLMLQ